MLSMRSFFVWLFFAFVGLGLAVWRGRTEDFGYQVGTAYAV